MANEHGEWIMHGVDGNDPLCIHTVDELIALINEFGFLPLFKNEVSGFSVEERTVSHYWWSGDYSKDPWAWRELVARTGKIAYGKFFNKKAGFVSKEWFPAFANFRRDGYDFDALWDDEKANRRCKKIMDVFAGQNEYFSYEVKKLAGFGKDGEKNFDGTITDLQMMSYLCSKDFRRKKNKRGEEYGWSVAVYTTPENLWGYDYIASEYKENPNESWQRAVEKVRTHFPDATDKEIEKVLKI